MWCSGLRSDQVLSHVAVVERARVTQLAGLVAADVEQSFRRDGATPSLFGESDIRGHLTADQTETFTTVLNTLNGPDPRDAPVRRTLGERNADVMVDTAAHMLSRPSSKDDRVHDTATAPARRGARPTAIVTLDLDTALDRVRELGFADVGVQADLKAIRRRLLTGGALPAEVAEPFLCDANLRRMVVDPDTRHERDECCHGDQDSSGVSPGAGRRIARSPWRCTEHGSVRLPTGSRPASPRVAPRPGAARQMPWPRHTRRRPRQVRAPTRVDRDRRFWGVARLRIGESAGLLLALSC